jgi:hypothetical protein
MFRIACIAASAALLLSPDVTQVVRLRPSAQHSQSQIPPGQSVPTLPSFGTAGARQQGQATDGATRLTEQSRLDIIRYVSGEFARAVTSLPADKKGFHIEAGNPLDRKALREAIVRSGAAVNSGDTVQITQIEFRDHDIVFQINGGAKGHTSWRDRIHISMGGVSPVSTSTTVSNPNQVAVAPPKGGATLYLDFGRPLPNMSPDQLKGYLSSVFDFSKQRSAAVNWTETLPPKIRKAISQKRAEVGMNRDEVLAALGRPDRKVRERQPNGTETEDWIYGYPPTKTVFVLFAGKQVIRIDQYP